MPGIQGLADHVDPNRELLARNAQRRNHEDPVPLHEGVHALLSQALGDRLHRKTCRLVPARERLLGLTVGNTLDDAKQADGTDVTHDSGLTLQKREVGLEFLTHDLGIAQKPSTLVLLDRCPGSGARDRIPAPRETPHERNTLEVLGDLRRNSHRTKRRVPAGESLGHGDHVDLNARVLDAKPLAGPTKAAHDLVADDQNPMPVGKLTQVPPPLFGRGKDAAAAGHPLQEDCGNVLRPFELHGLNGEIDHAL